MYSIQKMYLRLFILFVTAWSLVGCQQAAGNVDCPRRDLQEKLRVFHAMHERGDDTKDLMSDLKTYLAPCYRDYSWLMQNRQDDVEACSIAFRNLLSLSFACKSGQYLSKLLKNMVSKNFAFDEIRQRFSSTTPGQLITEKLMDIILDILGPPILYQEGQSMYYNHLDWERISHNSFLRRHKSQRQWAKNHHFKLVQNIALETPGMVKSIIKHPHFSGEALPPMWLSVATWLNNTDVVGYMLEQHIYGVDFPYPTDDGRGSENMGLTHQVK